MKTWVITGGVACGKSQAGELLKSTLGTSASWFSSDREVQRLLDQPDIVQSLTSLFGPQSTVAGEGGLRANRDWLRTAVFGDAHVRQRLEDLLHPRVLASLESERSRLAAEGSGNLFLAEVPLHYEIGAAVSADLVIVVAASRAVQVRRLMDRRGLDESIIEQMLRAQWPIDAKVERADVVIWNDGDLAALEAQVLTLARQHWQA